MLITLLCLAGLSALADEVKPPAPLMPLGVYWAGEMVPAMGGTDKTKYWDNLEARFQDLQVHHVTAIWLTHTSLADAAEFARHAGKYGIRLVASLGELAMEEGNNQDPAHLATLQKTMNDRWADAPRPWAWGMGDEPRTDLMADMGKAVAGFKQAMKGDLTTAVTMPMDTTAAAQLSNFDVLTVDIYPFFSKNNINGPGEHGASTWYYVQACERTQYWAQQTGKTWWAMPQSYQEAWGSWYPNEKGDIILDPGCIQHWRMPTPAEIKWQTWAALANGARGSMYFIYYWPGTGSKGAAANTNPALAPITMKELTNTGAPRGMIYPDGRPTPQYEAMGETFGEVRKLERVLCALTPAKMPHAWWWGGWPWPGDLLTSWDGPDGRSYLFVVNGNMEKTAPLKFTLAKAWGGVKDLRTGHVWKVVNDDPFIEIEGELPAGEGTVLELLKPDAAAANAEPIPPDPGRRVYTEDFKDTKRTEADAKSLQNVTYQKGVFTAANGGLRANKACAIYDVYQFVGQAPGDTYRLTYTGGANGPAITRGVVWWTSNDGNIWTKLSQNQFDKPLTFTGRYLRVGAMWIQASSYHYGYLSGFTVQNVLATPVGKAPEGETKPGKLAVTFTNDDWKAHVSEVKNLKTTDGNLSAVAGTMMATDCCFILDADAQLGPLGATGHRTLTYTGGLNGPDNLRGVHWWGSDDGKMWTLVSVNEFNTPVPFRNRYLKCGIMWFAASDPGYGHLKEFSVEQVAK